MGTAVAAVCSGGATDFKLTGCYDYCTRPLEVEAYDFANVVESNSIDGFSITSVVCAAGYSGTPAATVCTGASRAYTVSGCAPTTCTNGVVNLITLLCKCTTGFVGGGKWSGGHYPTCVATSSCLAPAVIPVGYSATTKNEISLVVSTFQVTGWSCAADYVGTAAVATCDQTTSTEYTLGGCFNTCTRPTTTETTLAYVFDRVVENLTVATFNVMSLSCTIDTGTASATVCTGGARSYQVHGCSDTCVRPTDIDTTMGYDFTNESGILQLTGFAVTGVRCNSTSHAGKVLTTPCQGSADYKISGCSNTCTQPTDMAGYTVLTPLRNVLQLKTFVVHVSCAAGYYNTSFNSAASHVCTAGTTTDYTLSGCAQATCANGAMNFTHTAAATVTCTCHSGFTGGGRWISGATFPVCIPTTSCSAPPPNTAAGYVGVNKKETNVNIAAFEVTGWSCAEGYASSSSSGGAIASTCDRLEFSFYALSGCALAPCRNGVVDRTALSCQCKTGFTGGGAWSSAAAMYPACNSTASCAPPSKSPLGYVNASTVEHSLNLTTFHVTGWSCAAGFVGTAVAVSCDQSTETKYTLSGCFNTCTRPTTTTAMQQYDFTNAKETDLSVQAFAASNVTCLASAGYAGTAVAAVCTGSNRNYVITGCIGTCSRPTGAAVVGYDFTNEVSTLQREGFSITGVQCASSHVGTATTQVCEGNIPDYTITGCTTTCTPPTATVGYLFTSASGSPEVGDFNIVGVSCVAATHAGTAVASVCRGGSAEYSVVGCFDSCTRPVMEPGYDIADIIENQNIEGFSIAGVTCVAGYVGTPLPTVCSGTSRVYSMSGCAKATCSNGVVNSNTLHCTCNTDYTGGGGWSLVEDGKYPDCTFTSVCTAPTPVPVGYMYSAPAKDDSSLQVLTFQVTGWSCAATYDGSATTHSCDQSTSDVYLVAGCTLTETTTTTTTTVTVTTTSPDSPKGTAPSSSMRTISATSNKKSGVWWDVWLDKVELFADETFGLDLILFLVLSSLVLVFFVLCPVGICIKRRSNSFDSNAVLNLIQQKLNQDQIQQEYKKVTVVPSSVDADKEEGGGGGNDDELVMQLLHPGIAHSKKGVHERRRENLKKAEAIQNNWLEKENERKKTIEKRQESTKRKSVLRQKRITKAQEE